MFRETKPCHHNAKIWTKLSFGDSRAFDLPKMSEARVDSTSFMQQYSSDRLYPSYYSEVELSGTPVYLQQTRQHRVLPRPFQHIQTKPTNNTAKFTAKNFNAALKKFALQANKTIKRTFKRDFTMNFKSNTSVSSMPINTTRLNHTELHKRALSDLPILSRVPVKPLQRLSTVGPSKLQPHQRKPTGPRELLCLKEQDGNYY